MKIGKPFTQNHREPLVHGVSTFISQPKDDDARSVQNTERENLTEVEIECQNDPGIGASTFYELAISSPLESQSSDVNGIVTKLLQELDGLWRDSSIRQKPHTSRPKRVHFVSS